MGTEHGRFDSARSNANINNAIITAETALKVHTNKRIMFILGFLFVIPVKTGIQTRIIYFWIPDQVGNDNLMNSAVSPFFKPPLHIGERMFSTELKIW